MSLKSTILTIAAEHILDLHEHKEDWVGTCPLCKHKKLCVSPTHSMFYCFNCGIGGDAEKLVEVATSCHLLP